MRCLSRRGWFPGFFSEAIGQGTMSLIEYSYLVKKVVFKISILPVIKVIAATFSHLFFLALAILLGCIYGYYPSVYLIQVLYYGACLFLLVLAMSYTTCAVVIFSGICHRSFPSACRWAYGPLNPLEPGFPS